jgi:hypothetical protein
MKKFLQWGNKGISMNQIAYQKPTHVYQGDSCPTGLGGYSHKGFTWGYYLPPEITRPHIQQPFRTHGEHHLPVD